MKATYTCLFITVLFIEALYSQKLGKDYQISINNVGLPLNDKGVLAGINVLGVGPYGKFDGHTFLKTSGFFLSGYTEGFLWANGATSLSYVDDYLSGTYAYGDNDPRAQLYKISGQDEPFGQSWQDWIDAVALGADYYDGDGDGNYNPVDLNGNGQWEPNEDRPDLIGDEMIWCVYHDNKPSANRVWNTVEPQGIEIRQTIFAYQNVPSLENVIFVRYRILNTGLLTNTLTDVYFGCWADPDIGDASDDVVGVDVPRNAGYAYSNQPDSQYGNQVPCFMTDFLSGPRAYIPGETFIDNNGNGEYDEGIDTPIDTAYSYRGQIMGVIDFPGAKNLSISSFVMYINGDPDLRDPNEFEEARSYCLGLNRVGEAPDPCTFRHGEVRGGVDCATVDPRFWFSGDPVTDVGWICNQNSDVRQMTNTGPFKLEAGKENELVLAYVVGRGGTPLDGINHARSIDDGLENIFAGNFNVVSDMNDSNIDLNPEEFSLAQNFPNPFNPTTIISYQIPELSFVALKIFDVLGNEIEILVNEEKPAGNYSIEFNAATLSSGVYFYRIQAGDFIQTKKMVLLK